MFCETLTRLSQFEAEMHYFLRNHWTRGQSGILILQGSGDASGSLHRSIGIEMELGQYADGKMVHFLQIPTLVAGFLQQSLGAT
jgi:hypothetical protein